MTTLVSGPWTGAFPTETHLTFYETTPYGYGIADADATQLNCFLFDGENYSVTGAQWMYSNDDTTWTTVDMAGALYVSGGSAVRYVIAYFQALDNTTIPVSFSIINAFGAPIQFNIPSTAVDGWQVSTSLDFSNLNITNFTGATGLLSLEFQLAAPTALSSLTTNTITAQSINLQAAALFVDGDPPCFGPKCRILCPCGERVPIPRLFPRADVTCVSPGGTRGVATARILRQVPANRPSQRVFEIESGVEVTKHHQLLVRESASLLRPPAEWYCSKCAATGVYMSCSTCAPDLLSAPGYKAVVMRDVVATVPTAACEQVYHVHFENKALRRYLVVVGDGDTLSETLRSSPLPRDWER